MWHRIRLPLFALALAAGLALASAAAAEIGSGKWGTSSAGADWVLSDDGVLTVSGGTGKSQSGLSQSPWAKYSEKIRSAVFENVTFNTDVHLLLYALPNLVSVVFEDSCVGSSVTQAHRMFEGCTSLSEVRGLSIFGSGRISSLSGLFKNCAALVSADVSGMVSQTTSSLDLSSMCEGCAALQSITLGGAISGCVASGSARSINLSSMFKGCASLQSADVRFSYPEKSTAAPITSMKEMFYGCEALTIADFSTYQTGAKVNADNLSALLEGCVSLKTVIVSSWLPKVYLPEETLYEEEEWYSLVAGAWLSSASIISQRGYLYDIYTKTPEDTRIPEGARITGVWGDCVWTLDVDTGSLSIENETATAGESLSGDKSPWIGFANQIESVSFTRVRMPKICNCLFQDLKNLRTVAFSECETESMNTSYANLFAGCVSLVTLDLSDLPTKNVTSANGMMMGCSRLTSLTLPDFLDSSATRAGALSGCTALGTLVCGKYFSVNGTGLPMTDAAGRVDWYEEASDTWYTDTESFPDVFACETGKRIFTKTGRMTDLSGAALVLLAGDALAEEDGSFYAVYSGEDICPDVQLVLNDHIVPAERYTVSYSDNRNAGAARVSFSGNPARHCSGGGSAEFTIRPAAITKDMAALSETAFVFTGGEIRPRPVVTFRGGALQAAVEDSETGDYRLAWQNNVNVPAEDAGDAMPCAVLTARAGGNFTVEGEILLPFAITPMPLTEADVCFEDEEPVLYDGTPKIPAFQVRSAKPIPEDGERIVFASPQEGSSAGDYTVSAENNTEIGIHARLTVTFRGNYTGAVTREFAVLAAMLWDLPAASVETPTYTGETLTPEIALTAEIRGETYRLWEDTDYTVEKWENATDAYLQDAGYDEEKRPCVTLTGRGIFGGSVTIPFEIAPRDLSEAEVRLPEEEFLRDGETEALYRLYDGESRIPAPAVTLTLSGEGEDARILTVPEDAFCAVCLDMEGGEAAAADVGSYRVRVRAKTPGNFSGTADSADTFAIRPAPLTADMVRFVGENGDLLLPGEYAAVFTGGAIEPEIAFVLNGKALRPASAEEAAARFYQVSYEHNRDACIFGGEDAPEARLEGRGNLVSEAPLSIPFSILPRPIGETGIGIAEIPALTYTGGGQQPEIALTGEYLLPDGAAYSFRLQEGEESGDYTVSFENPVNAAPADSADAPTAVVAFQGNFSGTLRKTFAILPLDLSAEGLSIEAGFPDERPVYTGEPLRPVPALSAALDGNALSFQPDADYTLRWENNVNAAWEGDPAPCAVAVGRGNFAGERRFPFSIGPRGIEEASVRLGAEWLTEDEEGNLSAAFSGQPRVPTPELTLTLSEGEEGAGALSLTVPQEALSVECRNGDGEAISDWESYTGVVSVRVTARENGNFTGTASAQPSFTIFLLPLSECDRLSLAIPGLTLLETGRAKTPEILAEKAGVGKLRQGADFTVEYENNIVAGTATATLTSMREPYETQTMTFAILPAGEKKAALPNRLRRLRAGALAGAAFWEIELPAACETIEKYAFAGEHPESGQTPLQITIPNAQAQVDAEAFGALSGITLCAPEGLFIGAQQARDFCRERGIYFEAIDEPISGPDPESNP